MGLKNIWVVYGGNSSEREVSLKSGSNVAEALKKKGFEVKAVEIQNPADFVSQCSKFLMGSEKQPDLVFIGLHGEFGEDGHLQGYLETIGVPYVGSGVLSSALSLNKVLAQRILNSYSLPIAKFFELNKNSFFLDKLLKEEPTLLSKKYFIKAARQGSTLGVYRYDPKSYIESERVDAFESLCQKAFHFDDEVLLEEWIEGRELTCAVVHGKAFPIVEIRPLSKFYDFQSKYTAGQTEYICPAPIEADVAEKIKEACVKASECLRCQDYVRIDVMLKESGDFYILEANTLPGMTATSLVPKAAKAEGMNFEEFLEYLVLRSYERQTK